MPGTPPRLPPRPLRLCLTRCPWLAGGSTTAMWLLDATDLSDRTPASIRAPQVLVTVRRVTDESWQLKISRAYEHVAALESEIASYLAGNPFEQLPRLQELSNIDKHRHVHLLPMLPSTVAHPHVEGVTWRFALHPPTATGGTVGWFLHSDRELPAGFVGEVHPTIVLPPSDDDKPFYAYPVKVTDDLNSLVGAADTAARQFMTRACRTPV